MILRDLLTMAQQGAQEPFGYWFASLENLQRLIGDLDALRQTLEEGTPAKATITELIRILQADQPDEFALARNLAEVAEIFRDEPIGEQATLVSQFTTASIDFFRAAQSRSAFAAKRRALTERLSADDRQAYDLRLFKGAGMIWCLEFYLALYKAIVDAPSDEEKRRYLLSESINLGFGEVPGLVADFYRDEALDKFIELILNDQIREELSRAYYFAKKDIVQAQEKSTTITVEVFRQFILSLLGAYQKMGIYRLASVFLTPYGHQPLIADIKI